MKPVLSVGHQTLKKLRNVNQTKWVDLLHYLTDLYSHSFHLEKFLRHKNAIDIIWFSHPLHHRKRRSALCAIPGRPTMRGCTM